MIRQVTIAVWLSLLISFSAIAQDAKLIEAAKKEPGPIVAYGSLESNTVEPIVEAFKKKTGLTVEYWRASATKVMDRALAEQRAGKSVFDVMVNNSGAIQVMKKEGLFAKYISPAAKAFPKGGDRSRPRSGLSQYSDRHRLQQRIHEPRRDTALIGRSAESKIPR